MPFAQSLLWWLHHHSHPLSDALMLFITQLGSGWVLLLVGLLVGIFFRQRAGHWHELLALSLANGLGQAFTYSGKAIFHRARPQLWDTLIHPDNYSFPSGHALVATAVYGLIAIFLSKDFPRYRRLSFSLASVLILLIGLSRLYLGVHWLSDVVAGHAIGLVIALGLNYLFSCSGQPVSSGTGQRF